MHFQRVLVSAATLASTAFAHMNLHFPPPFNATNNPHRTTAADPYLEYPYDCCGPDDRWMYPCRGYQKLLDTPQGAPTATWQAGSTANWNISGTGNHFGGSCQVGFSTDKGQTFHVATSYEGNCPRRDNGDGPDGQDFEFVVPSDLDPGVQIFAWIWYNREQELNMNCAAVNITEAEQAPAMPASTPSAYGAIPSTATAPPSSLGTETVIYQSQNMCTCQCQSPINISSCICTNCSDSRGPYTKRSSMAFNSRPLMFVADNGNDCLTPQTTVELKYPDPGPDIVNGDEAYPLRLPSGEGCAVGKMLTKQAFTESDGH